MACRLRAAAAAACTGPWCPTDARLPLQRERWRAYRGSRREGSPGTLPARRRAGRLDWRTEGAESTVHHVYDVEPQCVCGGARRQFVRHRVQLLKFNV